VEVTEEGTRASAATVVVGFQRKRNFVTNGFRKTQAKMQKCAFEF
jgi:hypothetical protein